MSEASGQLKGEPIDYFIGPVGSGTTISGIGESLKKINPNAKIIAVEHEDTPVVLSLKDGCIFDTERLKHKLYGVGAFGLPQEKLDINLDIIDEVRTVTDEDYNSGCQMLKDLEGKPVGRSSGAAFSIALRMANEMKNKNILICFSDAAWKYDERYPYFK